LRNLRKHGQAAGSTGSANEGGSVTKRIVDYRAYWKGETTQDLRFGMEGIVFKASGHHDPESAEYQAWLFQPDNAQHLGVIIGPNDEQTAFYCEWKDFDILEAASEGNGQIVGIEMANHPPTSSKERWAYRSAFIVLGALLR
jgi:hypothetical protein